MLGAATIIWAGNSANRRNSRFPDALIYSALLTMAFVVLAFSPTPAITVGAYLLFAIACFAIPMLTSSGWAELLSARELAVGAAAINTLSQIGAFVTPFAWGVLRDASGDFRAGLLLLAGLSLGLTLMLWQLCRQLRRRPVAALAA